MIYNVGDILWVVGERPGIKVYRITEQITSITLTDTITTFAVESIGPSNKIKTFELDKLQGTIFTSADDAKEYMLTSAQEAIDRMIQALENQVNKFWSDNSNQSAENSNRSAGNSTRQNYIELPDGTRAKVNLPNLEDIKYE